MNFGSCSVRLALTRIRRIPVLKNYATNTPLVIDESCSEFVSSPTQVMDLIMTIFKTKLIAIIVKAID